MFGRSNNVTLTPATNHSSLGSHFHRHLPLYTTKINKGCGIRKCGKLSKCSHKQNSNNNNNNNDENNIGTPSCTNSNFTIRRNPRHNVAIATQVISPSAIGQCSSSLSYHRRRLIQNYSGGNDDDDDNDQNSLIFGRKKNCCSWSRFGCFGSVIVGSIVVMTIIVLMVGYMQSEKERVFTKPARFAQQGKTSGREFSSSPAPKTTLDEPTDNLDTTLGPPIINKNNNLVDDDDDENDDTFPTTIRYPIQDNSNELQFSETHYTTGTDLLNDRNYVLPATHNYNNNHDVNDADFLNEISDFTTQRQQPENHNNGLHQQDSQQPSTSDEDEFKGIVDYIAQDSPPAEVKVLPPKDFKYSNDENNSGTNAGNNNDNDNNGLSFTIPIYTSTSTKNETGGVDSIANDILYGFTFSTTTPSSSPIKSDSSDDGNPNIEGTTTATNPYSTLTTTTTESSSLSQNSDAQSGANNEIVPPLDIPIVAKLQTDLFDDDDNSGDDQVSSQNYKQSAVTVRNNYHYGIDNNKDISSSDGKIRYGGGNRNAHNSGRHLQHPPPPKIKIQDRTYTPRPGSIVLIPERPKFNSKHKHQSNQDSFQPSARPQSFPVKTASTASSFSKLYEFQEPNSNHNNNFNNNAPRPINSKIEYIHVEPTPTQNPINNQPHQSISNYSPPDISNYDFSPSTSTTPRTFEILAGSTNDNNNNNYNNNNPFIVDHSNQVPNSNMNFPGFESSRFLSSLNPSANVNSNNGQINSIQNPASSGTNRDFGIATNAHHLASIASFDNFDFSKFLTKTPEPTASNNYGGATTPSSDAELTRRTFYMPTYDSASSSSGSTNTAFDPLTYLYGGAAASASTSSLTNVLGSPTSAGASLSLYQNNFDTSNSNNYYGNNEGAPSGTLPIDLASSYIPVSFNSNSQSGNSNYGQFRTTNSNGHNSNNHNPIINYNDPTLALANYYPGNNNNNNQNSAPNYNTITQGIHLLSLLSGNIPHHLLSTTDQHQAGSSISESSAKRPELQIAALAGYGGSGSDFVNRLNQATQQSYSPFLVQGRSLETSDLYPTKTLSVIPDQLGSFSQNILTKFNDIKRKAEKSLKSKTSESPKITEGAQPIDILGIRGLMSKISNSKKIGRDDNSDDAFSIVQPESSSLVKKSSATIEPSSSTVTETTSSTNSVMAESIEKTEKGLKSGFYT